MDEAKTSDSVVATAATAQPFQAPALDGSAVTTAVTGNDARPNIDVILDVPVTLSLEVGRAQMSVGRLLRLSFSPRCCPPPWFPPPSPGPAGADPGPARRLV